MTAAEPSWPRLLFIGDVPVEATYHGSALLFRLLQRYPADRLTVIEGNICQRPEGRKGLPGVRYSTLKIGNRRLLNTRLHGIYSGWLFQRSRARAGAIPSLLGRFRPDAVLTVAHGYSWVTAAQFASSANLPLHLIVHDDIPRSTPIQFRARLEREFARVFAQAKSRLCVSQPMLEEYERRYGVRGTLLLPSRAVDALSYTDLAERLASPRDTLVVAFAGTINSPGYATLLRRLATSLRAVSGELLIFGPLDADQAVAAGLSLPNIRLGGMLTSEQLRQRLRSDVDVLFVPMSFTPDEASNMQLSFPSKLTDYTAVGLPLLIWGPPDCSAARWARENPGVAAVVTSDSQPEMDAVIERLVSSLDYRRALAAQAQAVGARDFSADTAVATLRSALLAADPN